MEDSQDLNFRFDFLFIFNHIEALKIMDLINELSNVLLSVIKVDSIDILL